METPRVHLNGTSRDALLDQCHDAGQALRIALEKLSDMSPNARDYYVQGDGVFARAQEEHSARLSAVRHVLKEVHAIHEAVAG